MSAETDAAPAVNVAGGRGALLNWPALMAVLFWGAMGPVAKHGLDSFPALAFTSLRPAIAAALIFLYLKLRGQPILLAREDYPRALLAGALGTGMAQFFYIFGLSRTSVSHNVVLISISPLIIAAWQWGVKREPLEGRSLTGVVGGFIGVVLLVVGRGAGGGGTVIGDLISVCGAIAWMGATIWPMPLLRKYGAMQVSGWLLLMSMVVTLPIGAMSVRDVIINPPGLGSWLTLLYAALFGILIGNTLWQRAVQKNGASRTLVYLYLEPVLSIILAVIFLGERMGPLQAAGALLAMAGVVLVRR